MIAREAFKIKIDLYEKSPMPIAYIDESGFSVSMPRLHGYSRIGTRCYGYHDWAAKGRVNAIGAIIDNEFICVGLFESNINSDVFYAWVKQALLPSLKQPTVIVIDNASFHKRNDIIEAILDAGHIIEWLPKYSPDLNKIEMQWAAKKHIRRTTGCSIDELFASKAL